jgi:MFS transporter, ACS family, aldohexuronate transporter
MASTPRAGDERTATTAPPSVAAPPVAFTAGHYRWVICALLFFATTINYVDRQVIGILAKDLQAAIGWTEIDYGNIVAAFNAAYALGLLLSGRLIDRFGTRLGYALAITLWSLAGMATALARSAFAFGLARAALGLGEAANFPAAIKTIAEWFPKKERALATGLFNAGTNVGAVLAPLTVPWIALHWGWPWAFLLTGAFGLLWLLLWLPTYRRPEAHPRLTKSELDYIHSDAEELPAAKLSWMQLIPHRQMAAFALGKYLTDPVWWFYLYWIPSFLRQKHGLDLSRVGLPLIGIYLIADLGSIGGGWLSSVFIQRGWTVNRARKTAMLVCAVAVLPIVVMPAVNQLWVAVGLFGLAAAAHQGWSANLFTTASDMFPRRAIGSVVGVGGMAGAMGGATMAVATGYLLERTGGNYGMIFLAVGPAYLVALAVLHLLAPRLEAMSEVELTTRRPFSGGALLGYGFVGLLLGSFAGWCVGLLAQQPGHELLKRSRPGEGLLIDMGIGALLGIVVGIILGNIFSQRQPEKGAM